MRVTVIPIDFFPLSLSLFLSLAVSTIQFLPSRVSLSSFLLCTERERERENSSFLGGREEKTPLFSSSFSSSSREEKKEKIRRGIERRNTSSSWHEGIEGEVSWPEPWVQQGAPGEIPSHGYWFTMPRIIRHYLMWYMGSRGQRFSRLERRERDRLVKAFFPLRLRGESLICMIDGTRLHDRTHPITDRPPIVKLDV